MCRSLDVFALVLVSDDNLGTSWFQVVLVSLNRNERIWHEWEDVYYEQILVSRSPKRCWTDLSKQLFINGEPQVQVRWVVLHNPHQGVEIFAVLKENKTTTADSRQSETQECWICSLAQMSLPGSSHTERSSVSPLLWLVYCKSKVS